MGSHEAAAGAKLFSKLGLMNAKYLLNEEHGCQSVLTQLLYLAQCLIIKQSYWSMQQLNRISKCYKVC